jgi:hypothetical protein
VTRLLKVDVAALAATTAFIGIAAGIACPVAGAQPAGFPDLQRFVDMDAQRFARPFSYAERWASGYVFFRTPDGTSCAIGGSTWCTGHFLDARVNPERVIR